MGYIVGNRNGLATQKSMWNNGADSSIILEFFLLNLEVAIKIANIYQ
jgi:hypothetical protein